ERHSSSSRRSVLSATATSVWLHGSQFPPQHRGHCVFGILKSGRTQSRYHGCKSNSSLAAFSAASRRASDIHRDVAPSVWRGSSSPRYLRRMSHARRWVRAACALGMTAALLVGAYACGGDDNQAATPDAGVDGSQADGSAEAAADAGSDARDNGEAST